MALASNLTSKIEVAWKLRHNQQLEECIFSVSRLKMDIGEDADNNWARVQVYLLSGSLARARNERHEFRKFLDLAKELAKVNGFSKDYYLQFEEGLWYFTQNDYVLALDHFIAASSVTAEPTKKLNALMNVLLCFENLAIPYDSMLAEIQRLLKKTSPRDTKGARDEFQALNTREKFRQCKLPEIFSKRARRRESDQDRYLALWIQQLPYHCFFHPLTSEKTQQASSGSYHYNKHYRLRTLLGVDHPFDQSVIKLSEATDRFYLWVWKWLVSGDETQLDRVLLLLETIKTLKETTSLMPEEKIQLQLGLQWLDLFDHFKMRKSGFVSQGELAAFPLYEFESLVVAYFVALRDNNGIANDCLKALQNHPLWDAHEIHFRRLIEGLSGGGAPPSQLQHFSQQLALIVGGSSLKETELTIDLSKFLIRNLKTGAQTISQPIASAFQILNLRRCLSLEEFLAHSFGIRGYDPLIHNPKIFNLLARMKRLSPSSIQFRVKDGQVLAVGLWREIEIKKTSEMCLQLRQHSRWGPTLAHDTRASKAETLAPGPSIDFQKPLRRLDLEKLIGKSRSTTNRILSQWVKAGLVTRVGDARSTCYKLTDSVKKKLLSNSELQL